MATPEITLIDPDTGASLTLKAASGLTKSVTTTVPDTSGTLFTVNAMNAAIDNEAERLIGVMSSIETPEFVTPAVDTDGFIGTIVMSDYQQVGSFTGSHVSTDWVIALDEEFTNIETNLMNSTGNLTSLPFSPLLRGTPYFIKVRYNSTGYSSKWSKTLRIVSSLGYINAPSVSTTNGTTNVSLTPVLTGSPYAIVGAENTHVSTDWELSLNPSFVSKVFSSYLDTVNKTSINIVDKLTPGVTYYARARYHSDEHVSEWSSTLSFTVVSKTVDPVVSGVVSAYEASVVNLNIVNYSSDNEYEVIVPVGTISRTGAVLTWTLPNVGASGSYNLSITSRDTVNGLLVSDIVLYSMNIINIPSVVDQALSYNSTNIKSNFVKTTMDTSTGSLKPKSNVNVIDSKNVSATNKIYINNQLTDVEVGETLTAGSGELFTVSTVNDDGTVAIIAGVKTIACGLYHTVIVKEDGTLWATGRNNEGQLGLNDTNTRLVYTQVPNITNPKMIACGQTHTVIVKEDGTLWATGRNYYGQLGLNDTTQRQVYTQVPNITNPKMIVCGGYYTIIVKSDGTLWATGYNAQGQLGLNDTTDRQEYTQVPNITNPKMISCGSYHTVIAKQDGTLWATGHNGNGQLGLNDTTSSQVYTQVPNITNPKMISCGYDHTVIVKSDGTLWATGRNDFGQLGLNDTTKRLVYTQVPNITNPKMISSGQTHTVIVKEDGTLWATGNNVYGQLGLNDTTDRRVYTQVPNITNPKMITCGESHTVIVKEDGTIWVTGYNGQGQLGLGDTTQRNSFTSTGITVKQPVDIEYKPNYWVVPNTPLSAIPTSVYLEKGKAISLPVEQNTGDTNFTGLSSIIVKETVTNILDTSKVNTVNKVYINNKLISVKEGETLVAGDGELFTVSTVNDDGTVAVIEGVKSIACGENHTVIVKEDGTLWATGNNNVGQLGLNDTTDRQVYTQVPSITNPKMIACGYLHTVIVKSDGTLWATGRNSEGQLGLNDVTNRQVYTQVPNITNPKMIACGYLHTVIVKSDGTLWTTGYNPYGQLGLNDTTSRQVYTQVPNITNPKMIACGENHTVIVKSDGTLLTAGYNSNGQLGLNDTANRYVYTQVPNITNPKMIACGYNHTVIVKSDGTLWATGYNQYGQLGLNDTANRYVYTQVHSITNPKMISCGKTYTVIVKEDSTLWCTGYNIYGQLGLNDNTDRQVYTQVPNITNPKMIACGSAYTLIVKEDGTLWVTGFNGNGELGLGDATRRYNFTSTGITVKQPVDIEYKTNYWADLTTPLSEVPTVVAKTSTVKFNDVSTIVTTASYANSVLTTSRGTLDLPETRELVTEVISPMTNTVTEITAQVMKLAQ